MGASASRKRKRESDEDDDDVQIDDRPAKRSAITLADFTIHCVLGEGAFGQVVLTSVRGEDRMMAMKIITKEPQMMNCIVRESRILQVTRDSPFLCHAHAGFQTEEKAYFIMDYLPGGSLQDLLKTCKFLDEDKVRFYTAELVCGLQFLHQRGIAHRDLKPDNIMLDRDGHVRIIDVGLAKDGLSGSETAFGYYGTYYYMAPEVFSFKPYGTEADWWSLGITVCKLMAGRFPFYSGQCISKLKKSIKKGRLRFPARLSRVSRGFIRMLLNKNPKKRLGPTGDIRAHPFFRGIDWKELEERRAEPPFRPFLKDRFLTTHSWSSDKSHPSRWWSSDWCPGLSFRSPSWK